MKEKIAAIIDDPQSSKGRLFAYVMQALIITSLITFSVSTLPDISNYTIRVLRAIEIVTVLIFTVEYLARIYVANNKIAYIFSFYGLIDVLAILPFYISSGVDLRVLRIFRLLRLFRILKLFRYNQAIGRYHRAFVIAKEELVLFSAVSMILLYLSSVGIYYFENTAQPEQFKSVFHSLWWAVVTLTTVGYGDIYPVTVGGRIFTFIVLMVGLGIVAVPAGLVASALSQAHSEENTDKVEKDEI
ncbi:ion transporter [Thiolapillus sp.]|uniref:ion transporter n=7 Tax=Thiolapillus sp. TaxID=2017437 RepID=UPI0025E4F269|nr:ion transporter [Thiolapillus sp.]